MKQRVLIVNKFYYNRGGDCIALTLAYGDGQDETRVIDLPDDLGRQLLAHGLPQGVTPLGD